DLKVLRDGSYKEATVRPEYDDESKSYLIGITFGAELKKLGIGESIVTSVSQIGQMGVMMIRLLGNMIFRQEGLSEVSGPVGIVGEIGKAAKAGAEHLIELAIIISLNLGILNLVPFPALDGGRLFLLIIEAIRGKPMDRNKEGLINLVGFAA